MTFIKNTNLLLVFLIEIVALGILAYWGRYIGENILTKIVFSIGSPVAFAVFWGTFLAPKATIPLSPLAAYSIKFILFLLVSLACYQTGKTGLAISYLAITYMSLILTIIWKQ